MGASDGRRVSPTLEKIEGNTYQVVLDAFGSDLSIVCMPRGDFKALIECIGSYRDALAREANKDAEIAELASYAREATKALTDIVGGGSELFSGRVGSGDNELYKADIPFCVARSHERRSALGAVIVRLKAENERLRRTAGEK